MMACQRQLLRVAVDDDAGGAVRIRCFKLIMAMKVEYEAAHGSTTQQYTHKNTMSADSSVSKKPL